KQNRTRVHPKLETLEHRETPALTANVVATSLADTPGNQATIGEVVRYRVQVEVPFDSTTYNSIDLNALLPTGLDFLNDGTAKIALVSDGGLTSSLAPAGSNLYVNGN